MRFSVLLVMVCLGVCSVGTVNFKELKNRQPIVQRGFDTENRSELRDQREEEKIPKAENVTENFMVELKKAETNTSSMIDKLETNNTTIDNQTDKVLEIESKIGDNEDEALNVTVGNVADRSVNECGIEDEKDIEKSDLVNPHDISQRDWMNQRIGSNAGDYVKSTTLSFDDSEGHDTTKFERRSDDDVAYIHQEKLHRTKGNSRRRGVYKIRRMAAVRHSPKTMQRRTFDFWSMLGMGKKQDKVVNITKEVPVFVPYTVEKKISVPVAVQVERMIPVAVPKPYPVPVEKKVYYAVKEYVQAPYPVYKKVPYFVKVMVEKPVPVHVSKPFPIYIEKTVPYAVEKEVPYPVKVQVDRPVPVHIPIVKNVYYPVEKKVPFPVPVPVEQPIPVPVDKPYPVYVQNEGQEHLEPVSYPAPVEESIQRQTTTHDFERHDINKEEFITPEVEKILEEGQFIRNQFIKGESFTPPGLNSDHHDPTQIYDKKDAVDEPETVHSKADEKKSPLPSTTEPISSSTESSTPKMKEQKNPGEERLKDEKVNINDFGKKIKIKL